MSLSSEGSKGEYSFEQQKLGETGADRDAGPSHCSKGNPRLLRRSDGKVFILFSRDCLLVKASLWF